MRVEAPLWSDPATYGDYRRWSFYRWRWEFYRRRADLQEVFKSVSAWNEANGMSSGICPPRGEPGHYVMVGKAVEKEFGYKFLPDPTVSDHPDELLWVMPKEAPLLDMDLRWGETSAWDDIKAWGFTAPVDPEALGAAQEMLPLMQIVPWHRERTLLGFDLSQPIEPQLEIARNVLEFSQRQKLGQLVPKEKKRRHPRKWFGYLRTLDARAADATWSQIAKIHPNTAQTDQTARDIWGQAAELCFNF
ncbi:MAG: hypothetical protein JNK19_08595 [Tabrizicola sp.]|nr:hypothetical protein [Tabrizicola sp.]